jgi:hypothetical protein
MGFPPARLSTKAWVVGSSGPATERAVDGADGNLLVLPVGSPRAGAAIVPAGDGPACPGSNDDGVEGLSHDDGPRRYGARRDESRNSMTADPKAVLRNVKER